VRAGPQCALDTCGLLPRLGRGTKLGRESWRDRSPEAEGARAGGRRTSSSPSGSELIEKVRTPRRGSTPLPAGARQCTARCGGGSSGRALRVTIEECAPGTACGSPRPSCTPRRARKELVIGRYFYRLKPWCSRGSALRRPGPASPCGSVGLKAAGPRSSVRAMRWRRMLIAVLMTPGAAWVTRTARRVAHVSQRPPERSARSRSARAGSHGPVAGDRRRDPRQAARAVEVSAHFDAEPLREALDRLLDQSFILRYGADGACSASICSPRPAAGRQAGRRRLTRRALRHVAEHDPSRERTLPRRSTP